MGIEPRSKPACGAGTRVERKPTLGAPCLSRLARRTTRRKFDLYDDRSLTKGLKMTEELAAKFSRVRHAVNQIRGRVDTGGVTVEADGSGRLTALSLTPEALAYGPQVLADLLLRAHQHATEDAAGRANDAMAELYDDPVVSRLAAMTDSELTADRRQVGNAPTISQPQPSQYSPPPPNSQPQLTYAPPATRQYAVPSMPAAEASAEYDAAAATVPQDSAQWAAYRIAQSRAARARAEAEALRNQSDEWDAEDTRNRKYW
ncbi:YbaB/EbfC family nucleoid-associated protein [Nocardia mangyaensis]|nr:YbaB/EbfC family nucleoid-associated protein [Nocardia mangyaensis]